jgi:hypothetical protein
MGFGAVIGATSLPRVRRLLSADAIIGWATVVFITTLSTLALVRMPLIIIPMLIACGFAISGHPDGTIWILLHNNLKMPSEVVVVNRNFEVLRRFYVDAGAAHNLVFTDDDSQYLIADSVRGRVINCNRAIVDGTFMMTRGISLDDKECVVGDSMLSSRRFCRYVPGRIYTSSIGALGRLGTRFLSLLHQPKSDGSMEKTFQ